MSERKGQGGGGGDECNCCFTRVGGSDKKEGKVAEKEGRVYTENFPLPFSKRR